MRERTAGDWRLDLAQRHVLERRVEAAIDRHPAFHRIASSTTSFESLDFQLVGPNERFCELELKAKYQRYRGWSQLRSDTAERDLFILDELALRKILSVGRYAFLIVNDQPAERWIVWSVMDLVLASKQRVNRYLAVGAGYSKAKVLLNATDSPYHHGTFADALTTVADLVETVDARWNSIAGWPTDHAIPSVGTKS